MCLRLIGQHNYNIHDSRITDKIKKAGKSVVVSASVSKESVDNATVGMFSTRW